MSNILFTAPTVQMSDLQNLFIELTAKNCNQKCKHCYIDFPISKAKKDYISIDKIKESFKFIDTTKLKYIYLTGAEPMMHPDFNAILRYCLKISNVCICTNASFINEKKSRFLQKVENEGNNEIIFQLSFVHFDEMKNDAIRYRGAFRQTMSAIKNLHKYNFRISVNILNYYEEEKAILSENFAKLTEKFCTNKDMISFNTIAFYNKFNTVECVDTKTNTDGFDCKNSRTLTENGIFACPFLANDHRGRVGSSFEDYATKIYLETPFCEACKTTGGKMFSIV